MYFESLVNAAAKFLRTCESLRILKCKIRKGLSYVTIPPLDSKSYVILAARAYYIITNHPEAQGTRMSSVL